jgi:hypothetical protein
MGYCIRMEIEGLVIPVYYREDCRQAALELTREQQRSWVTHPGDDARLAEVFDAWAFSTAESGPEGESDLEVDSFVAEKMGAEELLFEAIAPYVKHGATVEVIGEDGERWRYLFEDQQVKKQRAQVSWDD